jgi:hypothetical protein
MRARYRCSCVLGTGVRIFGCWPVARQQLEPDDGLAFNSRGAKLHLTRDSADSIHAPPASIIAAACSGERRDEFRSRD